MSGNLDNRKHRQVRKKEYPMKNLKILPVEKSFHPAAVADAVAAEAKLAVGGGEVEDGGRARAAEHAQLGRQR